MSHKINLGTNLAGQAQRVIFYNKTTWNFGKKRTRIFILFKRRNFFNKGEQALWYKFDMHFTPHQLRRLGERCIEVANDIEGETNENSL